MQVYRSLLDHAPGPVRGIPRGARGPRRRHAEGRAGGRAALEALLGRSRRPLCTRPGPGAAAGRAAGPLRNRPPRPAVPAHGRGRAAHPAHGRGRGHRQDRGRPRALSPGLGSRGVGRVCDRREARASSVCSCALLPTGFFALAWRARLEHVGQEAGAFLRFLRDRGLPHRLRERRRALAAKLADLARTAPLAGRPA